MNETKKKTILDIVKIVFCFLIIVFQVMILIGQYSKPFNDDNQSNNISLVEHSRSNKKLDVVHEDLLVGDYTPVFDYYYPKSFGGQSVLQTTESGLKVAEFEDDTSVWMNWDNTTYGIKVSLVGDNFNYILAVWTYSNYQYTLDEDYGIGVLKTTNLKVLDIPYSLEGETAYTNIITLSMFSTVTQTYSVTPTYYTYIGSATVVGGDDGSYDEGYDLGYANGYQQGYDNGLSSGSDTGYQNGYNDGYSAFEEELMEDPESKGYVTKDYYDESVYMAEQDGIQSGKNQVINNPNNYDLYSSSQLQESFNKGVASVDPSLDEKGFKVLFNSILNAPYNLLNGILNFELFGVNVFNLLSFVFTLAVIGFVVKLLLTK